MGRIKVTPNKAAIVRRHGVMYWIYRSLPIINLMVSTTVLLKLFQVI